MFIELLQTRRSIQISGSPSGKRAWMIPNGGSVGRGRSMSVPIPATTFPLRTGSPGPSAEHCRCRVTWFDHQEIEALRPSLATRFISATGANPLRCPCCETHTLHMGAIHASVTVYQCSSCKGVLTEDLQIRDQTTSEEMIEALFIILANLPLG